MFTGFSPETVDFLWGIRMNNNRDWFLAHKKQYVDSLYEPMKALGAAVFEPFLDSPKRLFSFRLGADGQECLSGLTEGYLATQLEHGFPTLDFYHSLYV